MTGPRRNCFLLVLLALILMGRAIEGQAQKPDQSSPPVASEKATPQKRVTAKDSIVVSAHLTPAEIEDAKINDAYQPLYHLTRPGDCPQIVKLCETQIIPMAEGSKFKETRNKFLFLANREIAGCEMSSARYEDAEKRYQKLFDFIPVWPGISDSDYPLNYRSIGSARMMQKRWKEAAEVLEKSIAIFREQIEHAFHSDSEFMKSEHSRNLKMSEAQARNLLAVAYFQDGRKSDAMEMLEKAYQEAIQSNTTAEMIQQIISNGRAASASVGDAAAKAKWDSRTPPSR